MSFSLMMPKIPYGPTKATAGDTGKLRQPGGSLNVQGQGGDKHPVQHGKPSEGRHPASNPGAGGYMAQKGLKGNQANKPQPTNLRRNLQRVDIQ
jgi:hypothetical protein